MLHSLCTKVQSNPNNLRHHSLRYCSLTELMFVHTEFNTYLTTCISSLNAWNYDAIKVNTLCKNPRNNCLCFTCIYNNNYNNDRTVTLVLILRSCQQVKKEGNSQIENMLCRFLSRMSTNHNKQAVRPTPIDDSL